MYKSKTVGLVLVCISLAAAGWCADWPCYRGPEGTGIAPDTGINKDWNNEEPEMLWKVDMHDQGYAGPSVVDGTVFIIDHSGDQDVVRALDLAGGEEVWRFSYQDTDQPNHGFARATPVYSEGRLYTLSRLGVLNCLDASNGDRIWSHNIKTELNGKPPQWDYAASPLVDGDKLIVIPGGGGGVAALNKQTGETIWAGGLDTDEAAGYATPVPATFNGRDQYVVFMAKSVLGVDAENGAQVWRVPWETEYDVNAATPIVEEPYVFITSNYDRGCALIQVNENGASIYWENKALSSHFNPPIYYEGYLWGISGPLVCISPQRGEVAWRHGNFERGGLVIVDDVIIAVDGRQGDVVMVETDPNGYKELGRIKPLGGQSWTAPIISDGKMIIRNTKAIACLDLM